MKRLLFVDACVRRAESRTRHLAQALLDGCTGPDVQCETVDLSTLDLRPLDAETLDLRNRLLAEHALDHPLFAPARQFALADAVLVA